MRQGLFSWIIFPSITNSFCRHLLSIAKIPPFVIADTENWKSEDGLPRRRELRSMLNIPTTGITVKSSCKILRRTNVQICDICCNECIPIYCDQLILVRFIKYADLWHLFWSESLPALSAPALRWYKVNKMISPFIRVWPNINQDEVKSTNVNNQSISKQRPRLRLSFGRCDHLLANSYSHW